MEKNNKELFITYTFDAPRELVFEAWTDPEQLKNWYAPDDCTIEFRSIEAKENGAFHFCIHDPVHGDCWIKGIYKEILFPEKLVFTMVLTNAEGIAVNSVEAGKQEDWPEETITTVTFTAVNGQTQLSVHQTVLEETAKQTGAYQSWIKMFDKLNGIIGGR